MKTITATVVKHTGSHYLLSALPQWNPFPAVVRGKVRLQKSKATNPIAVGDKVVCEVPDGCGANCGAGEVPDRCGANCGTGESETDRVVCEVPDRSGANCVAGESETDRVVCEVPDRSGANCGTGESETDRVGCGAPDRSGANCGAGEKEPERAALQSGLMPSEQNPAVITEVLPRENYVIRRSTNLSREAHIIAANVDRAFIVVSLAFPEVKLPFLDRLLVTCEVYGIPATIVLNKIDLLREADPSGEFLQAFTDIYSGAGYPIIRTSATTGEGIEQLRAAMSGGWTKDGGGIGQEDRDVCDSPLTETADKNGGINLLSCVGRSLSGAANKNGGVNLLSGVSGVGKSSIIKALDPSLNPRVGEISIVHLQGKHTTTFYEMYPLCSGGYIIDTPGIRSFGLLDLEPEEIALYFPEMLRASQGLPASCDSGKTSAGCRFTPCTHTHEPGCAVKEALDRGEISPERYNSYLGMLEEHSKYREAH